uniref:Zinc knuckle CX2CX4HX4C domain-containing protein n=1 Tax=Cannabis sativa TaxID=3483 RepID=A0A803NVY3_CANSA
MDDFFANVSNSLVLNCEENTVFFTYEVGSVESPATISLVVSEHADGLFLVTFGCEGDKGRILEGQPWHFAQSVTVFSAPDSAFPILLEKLHYVPFWVQVYGISFMCKSHELAKFIASEIGDLVAVDQSTVREGTGPYLRIRVLLDVNFPITRGLNVRFIKMGREIIKWIDFKYERLPDFCYFCGKLDHTRKYCHAFLQKCDESPTPPSCPFTILLRGKEKPTDKSQPFQYPHPPSISVVQLPQGGLSLPSVPNFPTIQFSSLFQNYLTAENQFANAFETAGIMIPTPINPNNLALNTGSSDPTLYVPSLVYGAYSTDSILVADRANSGTSGGMQAVQSSMGSASVSAFKVVSGDSNIPVGNVDHNDGQPDPTVQGRSLASASGVKRASFQSQQIMVGGSLRETLKRARANDSDDTTTLATLSLEQRVMLTTPA